jgi:hypothetical protein
VPSPRADLALDPGAVVELAAPAISRVTGWAPSTCEIEVVKQNDRRVVARYEFRAAEQTFTAAGKWFANDRGAIVHDELHALHAHVAVPRVVTYLPDVQALFVEWITGPLLRDVIGGGGSVAAVRDAGVWLARFYQSGMPSPRACGPEKQRGSVAKWASEQPALGGLAAELDAVLAALPDPQQPVHYDYYHQQVIVPPGGDAVVVDLDEAGRGDPAFDTAHFLAHLERLALERASDATAFAAEADAFRAGYIDVADEFPSSPALRAFAWYKLLYQALRKNAAPHITAYAQHAIEAALAEAGA